MFLQKFSRVIVALTLFFFSTQVMGRTCELIASACLDGPSTKDIQGYLITRDCWEYKQEVSCYNEDAYDYCAPLDRTPGCNRESYANNNDGTNANDTYTSVYNCSAPGVIPNPELVLLNESYTFTTDPNVAECADLENNGSCREGEKVCVQGPETRIVNGAPVYQDCWEWKQDYACQITDQENYCNPLIAAGCFPVSSTCIETFHPFDTCRMTEEQYSCRTGTADEDFIDGILPNAETVVKLDTAYTLARDVLENECADQELSPSCALAAETCVEGAGTRNIDGVDIYKDCWRWDRQYVCAAGEEISTCGEFEENPYCQETESECLLDTDDGRCQYLAREFACQVGEGESLPIMNCGEQMFCYGGQCFDASYPPDQDFAKVIALMEAVHEFGYGLFEGEAHFCMSKKMWGLKNCCKKNDMFANMGVGQALQKTGTTMYKAFETEIDGYAAQLYKDSWLEAGVDYVGELAKTAYDGVSKAFSSTFGTSGATAAGAEAAAAGGAEVAKTAGSNFPNINISEVMPYVAMILAVYSFFEADDNVGRVTAAGNFAAAYLAFIGFPIIGMIIAVVMIIIQFLSQCDEDDFVTGGLLGQGLCHKVGSWCSKKSPPGGGGSTCFEQKNSYCCFASKLARIIQVQGRGQLGMGWGSKKEPNCSAFTPEQFMALDFDQIDFSEFVGDIIKTMPKNKDPSYALDRAGKRAEQMQDYYGN